MKRIVSVLVTLNILFLGIVGFNTFAKNNNSLLGSGTESDPYIIATNADLAYMIACCNEEDTEISGTVNNTPALSGYYKMNANLSYSGNKQIGTSQKNFKGVFDGNGYSIDYYTSKTGYTGLFYGNEGVIKNLIIKGSIHGNNDYCSALLYYNAKNGVVENCLSNASVSGAKYTSGLVCINEGTVKNCTNTGIVNGNSAIAAGIVAYCEGNYPSVITNCDNKGSVNAAAAVAGIVGSCICNKKNITVKKCNNYGAISSAEGYQIIGYTEGEKYTFKDLYAQEDNIAPKELELIAKSKSNHNNGFYFEYTITYNLNGGIIEDENYPTTYKYGNSKKTNLPTKVSKSGYEFLGWFANGTKATNIFTGACGNKEYTALYENKSLLNGLFKNQTRGGYYAQSKNTTPTSGVVELRSCLQNYDSIKSDISYYGMAIYKSYESTNIFSFTVGNNKDLIKQKGIISGSVKDIKYTNFNNAIVGLSFIYVDGRAYFGSSFKTTAKKYDYYFGKPIKES